MEKNPQNEVAVFAGGCFWCTEAVFSMLKGVKSVVSGYTDGKMENPNYDEVSTGRTGHAEAIKIEYDPKVISYTDLLTVFFNTHDPTTLNRQGNDVGTQYRSGIYYLNNEQKELAEGVISELTTNKAYDNPIVTEVHPFARFYDAEGYHQDYFKNNPNDAYCEIVIAPKLEKFQKRFGELISPAQ